MVLLMKTRQKIKRYFCSLKMLINVFFFFRKKKEIRIENLQHRISGRENKSNTNKKLKQKSIMFVADFYRQD